MVVYFILLALYYFAPSPAGCWPPPSGRSDQSWLLMAVFSGKYHLGDFGYRCGISYPSKWSDFFLMFESISNLKCPTSPNTTVPPSYLTAGTFLSLTYFLQPLLFLLNMLNISSCGNTAHQEVRAILVKLLVKLILCQKYLSEVKINFNKYERWLMLAVHCRKHILSKLSETLRLTVFDVFTEFTCWCWILV